VAIFKGNCTAMVLRVSNQVLQRGSLKEGAF